MIPSSATVPAGAAASSATAAESTGTTEPDPSHPLTTARRVSSRSGPALAEGELPANDASADNPVPGGDRIFPQGSTRNGLTALKSFVGFSLLNDPYGRGKGLSIAAPRNEMPGQTGFSGFGSDVIRGGHLRGPLGANWGPINFQSVNVPLVAGPIGGGRRG